MKAPEILAAAGEAFAEKNNLYGGNYKHFGQTMVSLFPQGLTLETEADWNRLGVFVHCVTKLSRYAANLQTDGHRDSAHDLMVYAAMLEELTI